MTRLVERKEDQEKWEAEMEDFAGTTAAAIDPTLFFSVIFTLWATRSVAWPLQIGAGVFVGMMVHSLALRATHGLPPVALTYVYGFFAALIWCGIVLGCRRIWR